MSSFYQELDVHLNSLKEKSLYRHIKTVDSPGGSRVALEGEEYLNFSSNNYLDLANHPLLKESGQTALQKYGVGSTASRLVIGTNDLHNQAEKSLAKFQEAESSILFNSGYTANLSVIQALVGRDDFVFSDKLNHASIIDGIKLSRAVVHTYSHSNLEHLEQLLIRHRDSKRRKLIVTDSIFSMDGDRAPLRELVRLKEKYGAILMVDEAHSEGVFGPKGRGLAAMEGIHEEIDIHLGTLSKALGCFGGYVSGRKVLIDYLKNTCRSFIYTTAQPPAVLGSILGAIHYIQSDEAEMLRQQLLEKSTWLRDRLKQLGYSTLNSSTQIIPVVIPGNENVIEFSKKLYQQGVLSLPIRYPTVPKNTERIRLSVMATHTQSDLEFLLNQFANLKILKGEVVDE